MWRFPARKTELSCDLDNNIYRDSPIWDDVKEGKIEIVGGRTTGESAKLRAEAEKIIPLGSAVLLADLAKKLYGGPVKSGKATYLRHVFSKGGFVLEKIQG